MACETMRKPRQTPQERAAEILAAVEKLDKALIAGKAKVKVGPQGAVAFEGFSDRDRDGVTDACAYRRLMVSGSALARAAIARAEQMAGRTVDRAVVGHGTHSHDGGKTWHRGH